MTAPDAWLDFGYWADRAGRRGLVTWYARTGQVHWVTPGSGTPELLAVIADEAEVRRQLEGWAEANLTDGIDWVRERLNPGACPACHGEGWVQSNYDDGAVQVACHCVMGDAL